MQELQPLVMFTPLARQKLSEVLEEEKATDSYLKIEVYQGGGCACSGGYRYALSLEKAPSDSDIVEEVGGLKVMAARSNADLLRGSKIDFVESLQRTGFKIENPNVHAEACGCGGH
ncbi:MAG TPA: iron-sulfur cluster assembly accessory protein [Nitrososphaerales archaeon]|nr:iron-sulfur cluster assembly accessory protein [Nitrososphaerales archaeon]